MKILFIEDQPESIKTAKLLLKEQFPNLEYRIVVFSEAENQLQSFRPDIVILDILLGGSQTPPNTEGFNTYDLIWNDHFCPIVVYSAQPDLHESHYQDHESQRHPLIKHIQKGAASEEKVLDVVEAFLPIINAMQNVEAIVHSQLSKAMKAVAPLVIESNIPSDQMAETVKRSGRRRLAALIDNPLIGEEAIASWEQYIWPPLSPDIQLGDILKTADGDKNTPSSFRVVLTPSCDTARSEKREPKVKAILVAKCCTMKTALNETGHSSNMKRRNKDKIKSELLGPGHKQNIIPFPPLPGVIPVMAADLRELELIPIQNIGKGKEFQVVASVDSPFRELVAWAHLQTACRPGLPERNFDEWMKEISDNLSQSQG